MPTKITHFKTDITEKQSCFTEVVRETSGQESTETNKCSEQILQFKIFCLISGLIFQIMKLLADLFS